MTKRHAALFCVWFVLGIAGCAGNSVTTPATPLLATAEDRIRFSGTWHGLLEAPGLPAREVVFRFVDDSATFVAGAAPAAPILWIRVNGDVLSGALRPYFDESRGVTIYTTFEGRLGGDGLLRGLLRERVHMQWREAGTWTAKRAGD